MNVFEIPVHPHADIFPMLAESELAELANDIAENGLREPLVLQVVEGVDTLIDGRNRRAACALVHVEPGVRYLNGEDPTAYIFSTNIARRHLTAGQKAMAHAMMYPDPARLKRKADVLSENINKGYLSYARRILPYPDLVSMVMAGKSLDDAYTTAKAKEQDANAYSEAVEFLEKNAPDLAILVREENKNPFEMRRKWDEEAKKRSTERFGLWHILGNIDKWVTACDEAQYSRYNEYFAEAPDECETDIKRLSKEMAKLAKYLNSKV